MARCSCGTPCAVVPRAAPDHAVGGRFDRLPGTIRPDLASRHQISPWLGRETMPGFRRGRPDRHLPLLLRSEAVPPSPGLRPTSPRGGEVQKTKGFREMPTKLGGSLRSINPGFSSAQPRPHGERSAEGRVRGARRRCSARSFRSPFTPSVSRKGARRSASSRAAAGRVAAASLGASDVRQSRS